MQITTYEFTTHDGRKGEVTLDEFGGIAKGIFISEGEVFPMEILDHDRVYGINHPYFLTTNLKENQ